MNANNLSQHTRRALKSISWFVNSDETTDSEPDDVSDFAGP